VEGTTYSANQGPVRAAIGDTTDYLRLSSYLASPIAAAVYYQVLS